MTRSFASYDGLRLSYTRQGRGQPLVCVFTAGEIVVQPAASHFPWLDDPARFTAALAAFLAPH
jgi:hypothetical protein